MPISSGPANFNVPPEAATGDELGDPLSTPLDADVDVVEEQPAAMHKLAAKLMASADFFLIMGWFTDFQSLDRVFAERTGERSQHSIDILCAGQ